MKWASWQWIHFPFQSIFVWHILSSNARGFWFIFLAPCLCMHCRVCQMCKHFFVNNGLHHRFSSQVVCASFVADHIERGESVIFGRVTHLPFLFSVSSYQWQSSPILTINEILQQFRKDGLKAYTQQTWGEGLVYPRIQLCNI